MKRIICLLIFFCSVNCFSKAYYVDPNGSDSYPGSDSLPFKTINKATYIALAGDSIIIRSGNYNEVVRFEHSGEPGKKIVMIGIGENSVINDSNISEYYDGLIEIVGKQWIEIQGLRIENSKHQGILCGDCSNILILNNYTYNTVSSGIGIWTGSEVNIINNKVEMAVNGGDQECISISSVSNFEVSGNEVLNGLDGSHGGEGICIKDGSYNGIIQGNRVHNLSALGIYVDAEDRHTYTITVRNNTIFNCTQGIVMATEMGGLLEDIWVNNNIIYKNQTTGIDISNYTGDTTLKEHPIRNCYIINNTITQNGTSWGGGIRVNNPDATGIIIRNNIFSRNLSFQICHETRPLQGLVIDHNLINDFMDYPDETRGNDFIEGDPMFLDTADINFRLSSSSPAIDKGSPELAPITDFDGNIRPFGSGIDIGAFEFVPTGIYDYKEIVIPIFVYPNPFNQSTIISYQLPVAGTVKIDIFNSLGERITTLVDEYKEAGKHQVEFKPEGLPQGMYYYTIQIGESVESGKVLLIK